MVFHYFHKLRTTYLSTNLRIFENVFIWIKHHNFYPTIKSNYMPVYCIEVFWSAAFKNYYIPKSSWNNGRREYCIAFCNNDIWILGPISVAVQTLADNNFVGILTGSSEARHQQAARWFLISFSTGGCYYGNTTRFPHEEMSA